jgi:hypothetical protein
LARLVGVEEGRRSVASPIFLCVALVSLLSDACKNLIQPPKATV